MYYPQVTACDIEELFCDLRQLLVSSWVGMTKGMMHWSVQIFSDCVMLHFAVGAALISLQYLSFNTVTYWISCNVFGGCPLMSTVTKFNSPHKRNSWSDRLYINRLSIIAQFIHCAMVSYKEFALSQLYFCMNVLYAPRWPKYLGTGWWCASYEILLRSVSGSTTWEAPATVDFLIRTSRLLTESSKLDGSTYRSFFRQ